MEDINGENEWMLIITTKYILLLWHQNIWNVVLFSLKNESIIILYIQLLYLWITYVPKIFLWRRGERNISIYPNFIRSKVGHSVKYETKFSLYQIWTIDSDQLYLKKKILIMLPIYVREGGRSNSLCFSTSVMCHIDKPYWYW